MLKKTLLAAAVVLSPVAAHAQATLTAETTTPGSTPHYIDTTLAAVLDNSGVAKMQITEGATLTNSVQAVAEGGEGIGVYTEAPWTALEARSSYNAAKFYGDVRIYEYGTTNRIFHVDDSTGITTVKVLQLEGGADLAEPFDVAADDVSAKPGMVVTIDPQNVGKLVVSHEAYDSKVAGVISGAGGIKPGMVMGQKNSIAHGEHPIALTGRVWTLCDASDTAIQPGDLLTTSGTSGHAMKVLDSARAQGAIIGKAMSRLAQGERGLVLVLVSLQ